MQLVDAFQLWSVSFWMILLNEQPAFHYNFKLYLTCTLDLHLVFNAQTQDFCLLARTAHTPSLRTFVVLWCTETSG